MDRSDWLGTFAVRVFGAAPELAAGVLAGLGGAEGHLGTALRAFGNGIGLIWRIGRIGVVLLSPMERRASSEMTRSKSVGEKSCWYLLLKRSDWTVVTTISA